MRTWTRRSQFVSKILPKLALCRQALYSNFCSDGYKQLSHLPLRYPALLRGLPLESLLSTKLVCLALPDSQVTVPQQERITASSSKSVVSDDSKAVADVLENTLWNRQLGTMSEEIVAALVCQIFEGALLL